DHSCSFTGARRFDRLLRAGAPRDASRSNRRVANRITMQNLRYALRVLGKQPLFTAIIMLTFALGIGANTAVFSVLNAVLLRPLPFHDPANLVAIGEFDTREKADPRTEIESISYLDYVDLRDRTQVFEQVAVYTNQAVSTLTDGNEATHVQGESVSANLFTLLGVQPILGPHFFPN